MAAVKLGERRSRNGDLAGAAAAYQVAAESDHPEAAPLGAFRLGLVRRRLGDRSGAETALRCAIRTGHPSHAPMAAFSLGGLLEDDPDRAAAAYQRAIDTGHADAAPMAALCLGELREGQGDLEAAAAAYRIALNANHADATPKAAASFGLLSQKQGHRGAAIAAFRFALIAEHPDPEVAGLAIRGLRELAGRPPATGLTFRFPDSKTGERVAAEPGLVDAMLARQNRLDLVGTEYTGAPSPDGGYEITFRHSRAIMTRTDELQAFLDGDLFIGDSLDERTREEWTMKLSRRPLKDSHEQVASRLARLIGPITRKIGSDRRSLEGLEVGVVRKLGAQLSAEGGRRLKVLVAYRAQYIADPSWRDKEKEQLELFVVRRAQERGEEPDAKLIEMVMKSSRPLLIVLMGYWKDLKL